MSLQSLPVHISRPRQNTQHPMAAGLKIHFHFRTLEEAHRLANMLSNLYPEPERVVYGLREMLINAVEHGNLGICFARKAELLQRNQWVSEIKHRLTLNEYKNKYGTIILEKRPEKIVAYIHDSGTGFDWKNYETMPESNLTAPNGRGIMTARALSFDEVEYLGMGNAVMCTVNL